MAVVVIHSHTRLQQRFFKNVHVNDERKPLVESLVNEIGRRLPGRLPA